MVPRDSDPTACLSMPTDHGVTVEIEPHGADCMSVDYRATAFYASLTRAEGGWREDWMRDGQTTTVDVSVNFEGAGHGSRYMRLTPTQAVANAALRSSELGQWDPAQCTAASVLDSLLGEKLGSKERNQFTGTRPGRGPRKRPDMNEYPIPDSFVIAGVWGAHSQYFARSKEPVPRFYSRHATVHGAGRQQFSRINALIAVGHVVAVMRLLQYRAARAAA
jgi:hypothetical protein